MPLTTRVVRLRSFLVPPLRVAARSSPSHHCPNVDRIPACATPVSLHVTPCRSLHLYKTARSRTTLGQHKVLNFDIYDVAAPSASQHKVNLIAGSRGKLIAEDVTLQELYDDYVKPGEMLYLTEAVPKGRASSLSKLKADLPMGTAKTFAICKAHTTHAQLSKKTTPSAHVGGTWGPLKTLNISLSSPPAYVQIQLDRCYRFLEVNCPVEFRIRFAGQKLTKAERLQPGDPDVWPWMHDHFPHLRPDFILKSMPAGTFYLIKPVTDGRIVQFVMAQKASNMPQSNLLNRLFQVKRSVQHSIKTGRQPGLPLLMRQQLQDEGQSAYSARTEMPLPRMEEKYGIKSPAMTTAADGEVQEDISEGRYLFATAKKARTSYLEKVQRRRRETAGEPGSEMLERLARSSRAELEKQNKE